MQIDSSGLDNDTQILAFSGHPDGDITLIGFYDIYSLPSSLLSIARDLTVVLVGDSSVNDIVANLSYVGKYIHVCLRENMF